MNSGQLDVFRSEPQNPQIPKLSGVLSWKEVLEGERESVYFKELMNFIEAKRASGRDIYPKNADIFNALNFTPFEDVKVIIIGQDPYHGPGQAHGLCFSVKQGGRRKKRVLVKIIGE